MSEIDAMGEQLENRGHEANLYRTQWLMAHSAIHAAAIDGADPQQQFEQYLDRLAGAEEVASQAA